MERKLSTNRLRRTEDAKVTPFKFHRTQVAKGRMTTTQIVKAFDVEEDVATRSGVRCKGLLSTSSVLSVAQKLSIKALS